MMMMMMCCCACRRWLLLQSSFLGGFFNQLEFFPESLKSLFFSRIPFGSFFQRTNRLRNVFDAFGRLDFFITSSDSFLFRFQ
jgi:hypothetical protein